MSEEGYERKLSELRHYIPFLEKMISKLDKPGDSSREPQLLKMKSLHGILTDPFKKLRLETLIKCESVLQKLHEKVEGASLKVVESNYIKLRQPASPDANSVVESYRKANEAQLESEDGPASPSPPHSPSPNLIESHQSIPFVPVRTNSLFNTTNSSSPFHRSSSENSHSIPFLENCKDDFSHSQASVKDRHLDSDTFYHSKPSPHGNQMKTTCKKSPHNNWNNHQEMVNKFTLDSKSDCKSQRPHHRDPRFDSQRMDKFYKKDIAYNQINKNSNYNNYYKERFDEAPSSPDASPIDEIKSSKLIPQERIVSEESNLNFNCNNYRGPPNKRKQHQYHKNLNNALFLRNKLSSDIQEVHKIGRSYDETSSKLVNNYSNSMAMEKDTFASCEDSNDMNRIPFDSKYNLKYGRHRYEEKAFSGNRQSDYVHKDNFMRKSRYEKLSYWNKEANFINRHRNFSSEESRLNSDALSLPEPVPALKKGNLSTSYPNKSYQDSSSTNSLYSQKQFKYHSSGGTKLPAVSTTSTHQFKVDNDQYKKRDNHNVNHSGHRNFFTNRTSENSTNYFQSSNNKLEYASKNIESSKLEKDTTRSVAMDKEPPRNPIFDKEPSRNVNAAKDNYFHSQKKSLGIQNTDKDNSQSLSASNSSNRDRNILEASTSSSLSNKEFSNSSKHVPNIKHVKSSFQPYKQYNDTSFNTPSLSSFKIPKKIKKSDTKSDDFNPISKTKIESNRDDSNLISKRNTNINNKNSDSLSKKKLAADDDESNPTSTKKVDIKSNNLKINTSVIGEEKKSLPANNNVEIVKPVKKPNLVKMKLNKKEKVQKICQTTSHIKSENDNINISTNINNKKGLVKIKCKRGKKAKTCDTIKDKTEEQRRSILGIQRSTRNSLFSIDKNKKCQVKTFLDCNVEEIKDAEILKALKPAKPVTVSKPENVITQHKDFNILQEISGDNSDSGDNLVVDLNFQETETEVLHPKNEISKEEEDDGMTKMLLQNLVSSLEPSEAKKLLERAKLLNKSNTLSTVIPSDETNLTSQNKEASTLVETADNFDLESIKEMNKNKVVIKKVKKGVKPNKKVINKKSFSKFPNEKRMKKIVAKHSTPSGLKRRSDRLLYKPADEPSISIVSNDNTQGENIQDSNITSSTYEDLDNVENVVNQISDTLNMDIVKEEKVNEINDIQSNDLEVAFEEKENKSVLMPKVYDKEVFEGKEDIEFSEFKISLPQNSNSELRQQLDMLGKIIEKYEKSEIELSEKNDEKLEIQELKCKDTGDQKVDLDKNESVSSLHAENSKMDIFEEVLSMIPNSSVESVFNFEVKPNYIQINVSSLIDQIKLELNNQKSGGKSLQRADCKSSEEQSNSMPKLKLRRLSGDKLSLASQDCFGQYLSRINEKSDIKAKKSEAAYKELCKSVHLKHLFKCMSFSCVFSSNNVGKFKIHIEEHVNSGNKCLYCCYCLQKHKNKENLVIHIIKKHGGCKYQCGSCFFRSQTLPSLFFHQVDKHQANDNRVIFCKYFKANLKENFELNVSTFLYFCDYCEYKSLIFNDYIHHLSQECQNKLSDNSEKKYILFCAYCNLMCKSLMNVFYHIYKEHNSKSFKIIVEKLLYEDDVACKGTTDAVYKSSDTLKDKGVLDSVPESAMEIEENGKDNTVGFSGINLYKCGNYPCDFSFDTLTNFRDHLLVCEYSVNCVYLTCFHCSKQIKHVPTLLEHLKIHGTHRYRCSLCDQKFPVPHYLKNHLKMHHKVGNFKLLPVNPLKNNSECDEFVGIPKNSCTRSFDDNVKLKGYFGPDDIETGIPLPHVHKTLIHCSICDYVTKVRLNLIKHLKLHLKKSKLNNSTMTVPNSTPINIPPYLTNKQLAYDKMTTLCSSIEEDQARFKPITEEEMQKLPKFISERIRYSCGFEDCTYITIDETMLLYHISALHSGQNHMKCPHCSVPELILIEDIDYHYKCHGNQLYKCGYCTYYHWLKRLAEKHCQGKHSDKKIFVRTVRSDTEVVAPVESGDSSWKSTQSNQKVKKIVKSKTGRKSVTIVPMFQDAPTQAFKCGLCEHSEDEREKIMEHCHNIHDLKHQFKCCLCIMSSNQKSEIEKHSKDIHSHKSQILRAYNFNPCSPEKFRGKVEKKTPIWSRDPERLRHIRGILFDGDDKQFTDNDSQPKAKRLKIEDDFVVDGIGDYTCKECQVTKKNVAALKIHIKSEHLNLVQFHCSYCDFKNDDKNSIINHQKNMHSTLTQSIVKRVKNTQLSQSFWKRKYGIPTTKERNNKRKLSEKGSSSAMKVEKIEKPIVNVEKYFDCKICNVIVTGSEIDEHNKKIHAGSSLNFSVISSLKLYFCPYNKCYYISKNFNEVHVHIKSHFKWMACGYCNETFFNSSVFHQHSNNIHSHEAPKMVTLESVKKEYSNVIIEFRQKFSHLQTHRNVAKKSTNGQSTKMNVARKSTCKLKKENIGFSYYNTSIPTLDMSKINTQMSIGSMRIPITAEKMAQVLNMKTKLVLHKCNKHMPG